MGMSLLNNTSGGLARHGAWPSTVFPRWLLSRPALWVDLYRPGCGTSVPPEGCSSGLGSDHAKLAQLEAVLFLAREPLGSRKLALLSDLADGTEARTLVRALNRLYDTERCAFRVVEVAGGFALMTRPEFAPWLRQLQTTPAEVRLSGPALETLAVVAYRQPVLRADIEAIRGVQCGEILRQLMERGLVRIVGKSEELGRPFLYGTTRRFLQVFGLRDLEELPRLEEYRPNQASTDHPSAPCQRPDAHREIVNHLTYSNGPGGDVNVKTAIDNPLVKEDTQAPDAATLLEREALVAAARDDDDELDDEEEEFEDEDFDDEDFDDEDFEDSDWEEVDEEEEDYEEEDEEEEEDEDLDEEDEDWDEEDEDWDEEDEEDEWDDEDEDEDEE